MSASIPVVIEVVGSINMDLVTRTTRMPVAGETLQANGFSSGRGGKGANQVVACARLLRSEAGGPAKNGVVVKMHGAVGSSDSLGSTEYLEYLEQEGIDTSGVESKDGVPTGTAVIIVEEASGENRILITPGANGKVHPDDVNLEPRPGGFVMFQMEISLETTLACIQKAKKLGKIVLLNVAPATRLPEEVFDSLDHLHVNESEAALLTGIPANQIKQRRDEVVAYFHSRGVKNVVITMGEKGVYWSGPNGVNALIDIIKCRAVDTTAAGDTFAGAYVAWLASQGKNDVLGALHFANRAAGLSVQRPGAQASMPFLAEVESLSD